MKTVSRWGDMVVFETATAFLMQYVEKSTFLSLITVNVHWWKFKQYCSSLEYSQYGGASTPILQISVNVFWFKLLFGAFSPCGAICTKGLTMNEGNSLLPGCESQWRACTMPRSQGHAGTAAGPWEQGFFCCAPASDLRSLHRLTLQILKQQGMPFR